MDVFELRYMKMLRFTLWSIGAWPYHVFEDAPITKLGAIRRYGFTLFLFTICCIGMVAQAMYLVKNTGVLTFIDLGQTWLTLLLCCVYIQRTLLPLQSAYQEMTKEFALEFFLNHHKNKTNFSDRMCDKVTFICKIATVIGHLQVYSCVLTFNFVPLYATYRSGMLSSEKPINGTFEHSVKYVLPVDQNTGVWCIIVFVYNFWVSYNLSCMFCCHDLRICVVVFHIWGHLKIFEHNLNYFPPPKIDVKARNHVPWYTDEENKEVTNRLKDIIKHYIMIREFTERFSKMNGFTLLFYYGFHLAAGCILLLECSSLDPKVLGYGLMTVVIFQQLIQLSVVFELIKTKGDELIDSVYGLPWECMDKSNRRLVLMLMQIVQQSLSVKACGMVPVGVQTMATILRASVSYFLMLRTFADI